MYYLVSKKVFDTVDVDRCSYGEATQTKLDYGRDHHNLSILDE